MPKMHYFIKNRKK